MQANPRRPRCRTAQAAAAAAAEAQHVGAPEGVEAAEADEQDEADDDKTRPKSRRVAAVCATWAVEKQGRLEPPGGWWWPDGKPEKLRLWCSLSRGSRGKLRCSASRALKVRKSSEALPGRRGSPPISVVDEVAARPVGAEADGAWKVRHSSVLHLGCRVRLRSSWKPCANWHFSPYLQVPLSSKGRHSSVL